jgi:hypothetical protein
LDIEGKTSRAIGGWEVFVLVSRWCCCAEYQVISF